MGLQNIVYQPLVLWVRLRTYRQEINQSITSCYRLLEGNTKGAVAGE